MSIDKIIIEDFKIFEGQHIFDLKNLNVFTGANNSGKSTLFKAISLFAKGLERGDFPSIDMFINELGDFQDLVNWNSGKKSFKIGFFIEIGISKKPFKVLYEFVEHNNRGRFNMLEVISQENNILLSVHDTFLMKTTDSESNHLNYIDHQNNLVFSSPAYDDATPTLTLRVNIPFLKEIINDFSDNNFSELFHHFEKIKSNDNFWWAESLEEQDFDIYTNDLSFINIEDFINDLSNDSLINIGDFAVRNTIIWEERNQRDIESYVELSKELKYLDFLKTIIHPIFGALKTELDFFKKVNLAHVVYHNLSDRVIKRDDKNDYLFALFPYMHEYDGPNNFVRASLNIFEVDAYVELVSLQNGAIAIQLVDGLKETDNEIDKEWENDRFRFVDYKNDYKNNHRQNIADYGKGFTSLVGLILKMFSVQYEFNKILWKNRQAKINSEDFDTNQRKLVLIEEPEVFLHPKWQSKLADFFVYFLDRFNRKGNFNIIVETHSEYLIHKLRVLTADNDSKLKPEDSLIYYFHEPTDIPERESQIKKIQITEKGGLTDNFGSGFIDESTNILFDIMKINNSQSN